MIAQSLRDVDRWAAWRYTSSGKKIPFRVDELRAATSHDRTGWGTYEQAVKRAASHSFFSGVGVFLDDAADGVICFDIDSCVVLTDPRKFLIAQWALMLVNHLNSYTEISSSGTGLKVFVRTIWPSRIPVSMAMHRKPANLPTMRAAQSTKKASLSVIRRGFAVTTGRRVKAYPADVQTRMLDNVLYDIWDSAGQAQLDIEAVPEEVRDSIATATPIQPPASVSDAIRRLSKCHPPKVERDGSKLLYWLCASAIDMWNLDDAKIVKVVKYWHLSNPIPKLAVAEDPDKLIIAAIQHKRAKR